MNNLNTPEEIREILKNFIEFDKGKLLRKKLKHIADTTYIQKHCDKDQIDFLDRNESSIKIVHPQSTNFPYYMKMFTVATQHIYADNIRQLIDKGIDIEKRNK